MQQEQNKNITSLPPYLSALNPAQRKAVQAIDGPVLVLAGAGTGKTRALTTRLGHILATQQAVPGQILCVTFTNKAAREMKDRVSTILGDINVEGWWLGTFHSLSARMLRRHSDLVGIKSSFTILDSDDQLRLVKQIMQANNIDTKATNPKIVQSMIDRWKNQALTPQAIGHIGYNQKGVNNISLNMLVNLYGQYQDRLKTLNACDFGDLLLHMITIFRDTGNGVLDQYHARFRYVMVDEYQDTNQAQYQWLRLLAQKHKNICCVGDDDQSIYGWRGAEVGNILKFEKDFPGAKVIRLEQNYRSTPHILGAANGLIAKNRDRLGKDLWTDLDTGDKIKIDGVWDGDAEARLICDKIENHQRKGTSLEEMAILVRASSQMRSFEERFNTTGIQYRVIGGPRFYERREIRDAIAYLRVMAQPDDDLALERIINVPKRGIGKKGLQTLHTAARAMNVSLYVAIERLIETDELSSKLRTTLKSLIFDFNRWRSMIDNEDHAELAGMVLDESGYTKMWQDDKAPDAPGRLDNLKEFINAMSEFENLAGFLEHISLVMESQQNHDGEKVTLMTLHGAKGLEFDIVFLPGWEEGLFPSQRSMDENGTDGLEEERRLAYVGITRARQKAFICHAANRRTYGKWMSTIPSRFIAELPKEHIEMGQSISGSMNANMGGLENFAKTQHWGQKKSFQRHRPPTIEGTAEIYTQRTSAQGFKKGARVFHQKFGYGRVNSVDGDKLEIIFDKAGFKKVIDRFVVPADQAGAF